MRGISRPNRVQVQAVIARVVAPEQAKRVRRALGEVAPSEWCQYVQPRRLDDDANVIVVKNVRCLLPPHYRVVVVERKLTSTRDLCKLHAMCACGEAQSNGMEYRISYAPGYEPTRQSAAPAPAPAPSLLPLPPEPAPAPKGKGSGARQSPKVLQSAQRPAPSA